jgi:hypothetical protein
MANETVICTYRARADGEERFLELLSRHWRTLHALGFVSDDEATVFRSLEEPATFVEIFTWVEGGFDLAHDHPDVLVIWEAMDPLLEEREGRDKWEFPHYERLVLAG